MLRCPYALLWGGHPYQHDCRRHPPSRSRLHDRDRSCGRRRFVNADPRSCSRARLNPRASFSTPLAACSLGEALRVSAAGGRTERKPCAARHPLAKRCRSSAPRSVTGGHRWGRLPVNPNLHLLYLASGFVTGKVYHVINTTTGARVIGLGLLTARDIVAFLRNSTAQRCTARVTGGKPGRPCRYH